VDAVDGEAEGPPAARGRSPRGRARWCAPAHASIATVRGRWSAKNFPSCPRESRLRKTTDSSATAPCAWNTFSPRSRPIILERVRYSLSRGRRSGRVQDSDYWSFL